MNKQQIIRMGFRAKFGPLSDKEKSIFKPKSHNPLIAHVDDYTLLWDDDYIIVTRLGHEDEFVYDLLADERM